ncbi:MAG TPA: gamma-glutamylcyclotransferase family protein [Devosiaceae bacterium]|jgi:gamma-glutamylcyclotransferase (GGCT)/AIG2-like uncharacterized protein YtfP|nr:gamma-glutamylcyclotransferase family protein [Devosiaceae bacterium]
MMVRKMLRYFAYGSNMYSPRLRYRVPGCEVIAVARLPGFQLRFHKLGRIDRSAKCDAFHTGLAQDVVIGVLYEMPAAEKSGLDAAEGRGHGYEEQGVTVLLPDGSPIDAVTYVATPDAIDPDLVSLSWYKDFVMRGAAEHALPAEYVARWIESVATIDDPDPRRNRDERSKLRFR